LPRSRCGWCGSLGTQPSPTFVKSFCPPPSRLLLPSPTDRSVEDGSAVLPKSYPLLAYAVNAQFGACRAISPNDLLHRGNVSSRPPLYSCRLPSPSVVHPIGCGDVLPWCLIPFHRVPTSSNCPFLGNTYLARAPGHALSPSLAPGM
jgi:hypothetical protein